MKKTLSHIWFVIQVVALLIIYCLLPGKRSETVTDEYYESLVNDEL